MKKIQWEVQYHSLPAALKYCKKCGKKTAFFCSGQFRVNAQKRCLDIWLVYKCPECDTTWNAKVYSRVSPQALAFSLLDGFHKNEEELVRRYAFDRGFLQRNGAEEALPPYSVLGDTFAPGEAVTLEIKSKYPLPVKVSSIVKGKLGLSQREYLQFITEGKIKSIPEKDLKNFKLNEGILLVFSGGQG